MLSDRFSALHSYEAPPDRLVLHLRPYDRSASLAFTFRPRYALRALSALSLVYDYHNPDARAVVPPARFVVR
jgi:hypothetical protein